MKKRKGSAYTQNDETCSDCCYKRYDALKSRHTAYYNVGRNNNELMGVYKCKYLNLEPVVQHLFCKRPKDREKEWGQEFSYSSSTSRPGMYSKLTSKTTGLFGATLGLPGAELSPFGNAN